MKLKGEIEKITASSDQGKVFIRGHFGGNGKTFKNVKNTWRKGMLVEERACLYLTCSYMVFVKAFKTSNKISDSVLGKGEMDRLKI